MKPSRLVTSGGVRRHTVRGIRKITKAALLGGAAAAAIAAAVGVAAPANARDFVTTEVNWGGQNCIWIWDAYGSKTARRGGHAIYDNIAYSGGLVGLDPEMSGADWISCTSWVNGVKVHSDATSRGSGHEVTCLFTL